MPSRRPMSALPRKRTNSGALDLSALCQKRTFAPQQKTLFDHLIGGDKQGGRNGEAKRLGGLEIDSQMEFGWLNNRQVAWFFALENPAGINADLAINIGDAYAVGHQAAGCGKLAKCIACWN